MAINRDLIGKTFGPVDGEVVNREAIYYALATNDYNEAYINGAREGGTVAPPLYAVSKDIGAKGIMEVLKEPTLGINWAYVVHGEQYFEWPKPLIPGTKLKTTATVKDVIDKGTGELLEVKVDSVDEAGDLVMSLVIGFFERWPDAKREKKPAVEEKAEEPNILFTEEMKVKLGQTYIYAEPSGDHNLIHVDPDFAVKVGLPGIILQGLCTMAFVQKAVVDNACGGDPTKLKKLKVRFSRNVLPGDTVITKGWLTEDKGDTKIVGLEAAVNRGDVVIKDAWAEVAK
ncbi:MAG: MaoC family dehydratase N-terminal domain-containing protein [Deltaproteobacteria bacterium]|uniref:MaoC family dehydratase N-terminal domain-containing protein n=1 Tax=Candidatus Zymogenus saltonus TaxID=2844893 RepID=A0A9D8KHG8_9DELT|nr:MaoC family dehydratase N-terminal domain-containing protein [Candidatus Zymogenus saltonus]